MQTSSSAAAKAATGIKGFDEITGGGLPAGRTTLLVGGPGSGKTVFALQFLVGGVRHHGEPGIFVAFEEASSRLVANFEGFGWNLLKMQPKKLFFLDAQPAADLIQAGSFDLGGLLAALDLQVRSMGARRIVFDALDVLLDRLPDTQARRHEMYRLHEWLLERELTGVITAKDFGDEAGAVGMRPFSFMQFMVDCAVILNHRVVQGVSQRNMRVQKYRGSGFDENESPFVIGGASGGVEVAGVRKLSAADPKVTGERVSSGVERLDTMLGGGYFRGASVLITGFPGTAKTTLAGAFAQAACLRGERTLFVSFDSDGAEVIRNLTSVGIRLASHAKRGTLRIVSARTMAGSAETLLALIKMLAQEHQARCIVIDPVSTLSRPGNELTALSVTERLIDWAKAGAITLVCTRLEGLPGQVDAGAPLHISTLTDTWIHLNYLMQAGERNRGLSIIKSRGTAHSSQVRELILTAKGVTLADTYTAGGEVLMGTMRWQKESSERAAGELAAVAERTRLAGLDAEEAALTARLKSVQAELAAKQAERALLGHSRDNRRGERADNRERMRELRGADVVLPGHK